MASRTPPRRSRWIITIDESPNIKAEGSKVKQINTPPQKESPASKTQAKTMKGPPTKRKKVPTPPESEESGQESDENYQPDSCLSSHMSNSGKTKKKSTPACSSTKKRKVATLAKRPDLVWCSSESEYEDNRKKKEPVNEELFTLYDTIASKP